MPRRPNLKNILGRLLEESGTPVYCLNRNLELIYANQALASLFNVQLEAMIGAALEYRADSIPQEGSLESVLDNKLEKGESPALQTLNRLCPPPTFHRDHSCTIQFTVPVEDDVSYQCTMLKQWPADDHRKSNPLADDRKTAHRTAINHTKVAGHRLSPVPKDTFLTGTLHPVGLTGEDTASDAIEVTSHWLHSKVQAYRVAQGQQFQKIPYLGDSPVARKCFDQARAFALSQSNVSLVGHRNSQIIHIAKAIYYSGFSQEGKHFPLLPIDCQKLEGDRVCQNIIDHLEVTATEGSTKAFVLLINADLLDESGQLGLTKILRSPKTDIRWFCTSSQPFSEIETFNVELGHRLSTLEIHLPALKNRRVDIPLLAQIIAEQENRQEKQINGFSKDVIELMQMYAWPRDYHELENVIGNARETALARSDGATIEVSDLPHGFQMTLKALAHPRQEFEPIELDQFLGSIEAELIQRAVAACHGNKTKAARLLGITRARLHRKLP